jgi:hypothetical protein
LKTEKPYFQFINLSRKVIQMNSVIAILAEKYENAGKWLKDSN